jgi:hypothetical protein
MVEAKQYSGKVRVYSMDKEYDDTIVVTAATKGAVLDKIVEASYDARWKLLRYISEVEKNDKGEFPELHWYVSVAYPSLREEMDDPGMGGGGVFHGGPDALVTSVVHHRHLEIESARVVVLNKFSKDYRFSLTSEQEEVKMNFEAGLEQMRHEGHLGSDWDKDFEKAVASGLWKKYLQDRKRTQEYHAVNRNLANKAKRKEEKKRTSRPWSEKLKTFFSV